MKDDNYPDLSLFSALIEGIKPLRQDTHHFKQP
ncbi:MAG TPA: endonuclease SmrB, partial [Shewanella frigidimarina]|nr:endonuclease SmrB [Shewanella frigidimarina]